MFWFPDMHDSEAARWWSSQPARDAYMIHGERIVLTTVYESPTRPYWYSLQTQRAGLFGTTLFDTEIDAVEHLMEVLMERQRQTEEIVDALADRYNELLLAEEKEHELSAEHAHVGTQ